MARGTDREKALIDGFKRNFHFATFLRCFIRLKDNLKREPGIRGFQSGEKKKFLEETFGRQEGTVKFFGLVDSASEDEFDVRLDHGLKESWIEREAKLGCSLPVTFYEWFKNEKVSNSRKQLKLKNL